MACTMRIAATVAFFACAMVAPAAADDYYWNTAENGNFGDPANWNDGTGDIPGSGDSAIFDTESVHGVYFFDDYTTDRLLLRSGDLMFIASGENTPRTYTLLDNHPATPALVVGRGGRGGRDLVRLTVKYLCLDAASATIGQMTDATGRLILSNADSSLLTEQHLIIGDEGFGALEAYEGSVGSAVGKIGLAASGYGEVIIDGLGAAWTCDGPLTIGMSGEGSLTISDEATVSCHDAIIAQHEDSAGAVTLSGGLWTVDGTLDVGMTGFGTLNITGGSILTNHTFATIGTYDSWPHGNGGVGEVTIDDGSWTIDGDLYLGFFGEGALSIGYESQVIVTGDASIGFYNPGGLTLSHGGTITLGGHLLGDDPEDRSLVINLRSATDYLEPAIHAGGTIDSFEPEVILDEDYEPQVGDTFAIAHADGDLGAFSFILPDLPGDLAWKVIQDEHDVSLEVVVRIDGDINGDGVVDTADLLQLLAAWGQCDDCPEDLDGNGSVNTADLLILLANWTT